MCFLVSITWSLCVFVYASMSDISNKSVLDVKESKAAVPPTSATDALLIPGAGTLMSMVGQAIHTIANEAKASMVGQFIHAMENQVATHTAPTPAGYGKFARGGGRGRGRCWGRGVGVGDGGGAGVGGGSVHIKSHHPFGDYSRDRVMPRGMVQNASHSDEKTMTCFKCGSSSHLSVACDQGRVMPRGMVQTAVQKSCLKCGSSSHLSIACDQGRIMPRGMVQTVVQKSCLKCGSSSHLSIACDQGSLGRRGMGRGQNASHSVAVQNKTMSCFRCGRTSHLSAACVAKTHINGQTL